MRFIDKMVVSQIGDVWFAVSVGNKEGSTSKTVRLNSTGKVIFDCLQEGKTAEEIADYLTEKYEVDMETAIESAQDVINILKDNGIIIED